MAEKYLDYSGVETLWKAVKDRDDQIAAGKVGYIALADNGKALQLWTSEEAYTASKTDTNIKPINTVDSSAFVKDGMLSDVNIIPAKEVDGGIMYNSSYYNDDTLFIQFEWNTDGENKRDYLLLTDIAPVYTEGTGIDITNNVISFEGGKSNQITTSGKITLGGTWLGDQLKAAGIKEINANTNLQDLFKTLLSVESWPSNPALAVSPLEITNSGPTIKFYTTNTSSTTSSSSVEAGTTSFLMVSANDASASAKVSFSGFDYGYSEYTSDNQNFVVKSGNPSEITITGKETAEEKYSIAVSSNNISGIPAISSDASADKVKLESRYQFTVVDGTTTVTASLTTPSFYGDVPKTTKYYALSTLEDTSEEHIVDSINSYQITATATTKTKNASITGYRKLFYGSFDSDDITQLTGENIRKAVGGGSIQTATGTYNITAKGKKLFWIAFPATNATKSWTVTKAITDGVDLTDNAKDWKTTSDNVAGANGYSPISYTIYYFAAPSAYSQEQFNVTIG